MTKGNYKILQNNSFGRYMVAGKNIKAGELILSENPTLLGPQLDGFLICFNCCRPVRNTKYVFCENCKTAVICGTKCIGHFHNPEECSALKDININKALVANNQITFPLRCLLVKKYKPIIWEAIMQLEPHLERRRDTPIWRRHKIIVEQCLRKLNLITEEDIQDELVQKICGILDVNTFEVRPPQSSTAMIITNPELQCLRGLYLEAALMAHDCVGNTHLSVDDDFILTIHASIDIPENSPIFFNYSNVLHGNILRQQHLLMGKYFQCTCQRCKDPTELGTDISSLRCHKCKKGSIRPKAVGTVKSDWECKECKHIFRNCLINSAIQEGRMRIEDVDLNNITEMENLHSKLVQTFHPNHYLILELQQNMVALYVRLPPNKNNLSRKIVLCQRMLEVFSKIEPGLSRLKAITLYQLQSSLIDLAHKQHRDKEIDAEELTVKLISAETTLKEAIQHLLYEPPKSPEGRLGQMALSELKVLRMSIINIQNDFLSTLKDSKKNRKLDEKIKDRQNRSKDTKEETCNNANNLDSRVKKSTGRKKK